MGRMRRRLRRLLIRLWRELGGLINFFTRLLVNGVIIKTFRGLGRTACGGFDWRVTYRLARASVAGGWIVQQVDWDPEIYDCDGFPDFFQSALRYWEAWEVKPGKRIDDERDQGNYDFDDQYYHPDEPGTEGAMYVRGTVRFFEGVALPPDMVPYNPDTLAGELPSTRNRPPFFNGFGATFHDLLSLWNCCRRPPRRTRIHRLPRGGRGAGGTQPGPTEEYHEPMTKPEIDAIVEIIGSVPAWTDAPYDEPKARQLAVAAERCLDIAAADLRSAVEAYYLRGRKGDDPTRELSRVYLLLRVLFVVPEVVDRAEAKVFGGWSHPSVFSGGPSFRLAWPVHVGDDGSVRVEDRFRGYSGRPYDALGEYDYFAERFRRRV